MNPTGITIIASVILGLGLTGTGAYLLIDNLVHPQGYLFESIMMFSLGVITLLLVAIAASIGKTILTFAEILSMQKQAQNEMRDLARKNMGNSGPANFSSFLSSMMQNPGPNNKITLDFDNGQGFGAMFPQSESGLEDMGLEDLEKELAKAVKKDDYERAEKINRAIKELKGLDDEPGEEPEENDTDV